MRPHARVCSTWQQQSVGQLHVEQLVTAVHPVVLRDGGRKARATTGMSSNMDPDEKL